MAKPQVLILHGWSDTSKSFRPLASFLAANGYDTVPVWLGDYISLDDDVGVQDVAKRLDAEVREQLQSQRLQAPFDMIVHSTGGLVAREWLSSYCLPAGNVPVKRLVMLAPANFGSRLAQLGQSMLGRLVKGWGNWFHTGKTMLGHLELASPYLWDLAQRDLFIPLGKETAPSIYGPTGVWPFVIVGSHPYADALRRIVNENGSDGTVRVCAANLNVKGVTVDFARNEKDPVLTQWALRSQEPIPFAVLPNRTHGSIVDPAGKSDIAVTSPNLQAQLGELILKALSCDSPDAYRTLASDWEAISDDTAKLANDDALRKSVFVEDGTAPELFHRFFQVITHVIDDHGADVLDYFLEFMSPDSDRSTDAAVYFHRQVLVDVHNNGANPAYRCLYADRNDLMTNYYGMIRKAADKVLNMSISANPPGDNISYFDNFVVGAKGTITVHRLDENQAPGRWLERNRTHFVQIVIPRCAKDGVFKMVQNG
ncbi:MAG TPA: alpha/beta fold hydrolase [Thermoanaerobaculia bacterium]|nr:alpha/beta fold hydrolase [Thermoanaerobaculia bacterium]